MSKSWTLLRIAFPVLATCWPLYPAQHLGFGLNKRTVTMERRLLPDIRLGNISLAVTFPRGPGGMDTNLFTSDLETLIAQSGVGIRLVTRAPEFEIRCYPTAYQPATIVAQPQSSNALFGMAGKPAREAHGSISLDARLVRAKDDAVALAFSEAVSLNASSYGSNTLAIPSIRIHGMSRSGGEQAPVSATDPLADTETNASLAGRMVRTLALRVASHVTPMNEQITVLLAQGGSLDPLARLAVNHRWTEYLEQLSMVPTPSDPADNAYLLYNVGVTNEALGYAASDSKTTLTYLRQSSINYTRAAEAKPSEKYFIDPQKRIETAIIRYTRLAENEKAESLPPPQTPEKRQPAGEKLTNADVIKLVKAHIDPQLIVNKIDTVPTVDFDLSVDGMVALSQSGVPSNLIAVMTNRMQRQQAGHRGQ